MQQDRAADGVRQFHDLKLFLVEVIKDIAVVGYDDLGLERCGVCCQSRAYVLAARICPVRARFVDPAGVEHAEFDIDRHQHDAPILGAGLQFSCRFVCGLDTRRQREDRKRGHDY